MRTGKCFKTRYYTLKKFVLIRLNLCSWFSRDSRERCIEDCNGFEEILSDECRRPRDCASIHGIPRTLAAMPLITKTSLNATLGLCILHHDYRFGKARVLTRPFSCHALTRSGTDRDLKLTRPASGMLRRIQEAKRFSETVGRWLGERGPLASLPGRPFLVSVVSVTRPFFTK